MEVYKNSSYSYKNLSDKLLTTNKSKTFCIYKNKENKLYFNMNELKIFLKEKGGAEKELSFIEIVRFIDTIPEKSSYWKRDKILFIASLLGFFGL